MGKKNNKKNNQNKGLSHQSDSGGIVLFLKKIFTWERIGVIATVASLLVAIWVTFKPSPKEDNVVLLKRNIERNINIIEKTFNPNDIPSKLDSLPDVRLVRKIQQTSLDLCAFWKNLESSKSFSDYITDDKENIQLALEAVELMSNDVLLSMRKLLFMIDSLQQYGYHHNINSYMALNHSKLCNLARLFHEKDSINQIYDKKASKFSSKGDFITALKTYELIKQNEDYYKFDDSYFSFIVETNKMIMIPVRKYEIE